MQNNDNVDETCIVPSGEEERTQGTTQLIAKVDDWTALAAV